MFKKNKASSDNSKYYYQLYDSVLHINAEEWGQLVNLETDLAMNPKLITLLENTLSNQAKLLTLAIRDGDKKLVSVACLALFQVDIFQSSFSFVQNLISVIRLLIPNAFKWKVLFCGLPVPSGRNHIRFLNSENLEPILELVNKVMEQVAKQQKAKLIVLKEFDSIQTKQLKILSSMGFLLGEMAPIYELTNKSNNFEDYLIILRAQYRRQIRLNIKEFKKFNFAVEYITHAEEIQNRFSDEVYQLYLNVWNNVKEKLECFPKEFFQKIAYTTPAILTLISEGQKPLAFSLSLLSPDTYYNVYVGLDYSYNGHAHLYFNLFYQELDHAFGYKRDKICLGQTSDYFKLRLGSVPDSRFFYVRPLPILLQLVFKCFQNIIFPKPQTSPSHNVFKNK